MSRLLELPEAIARRFRRVRRSPARDARLTRDQVYILPTPAGLLFAVTVFLILLGSINYGLGLGFALTFLLTGVGVVAMLLTYRNLAGLEIRAHDAAPVFAGEHAGFALDIRNHGRLPRRSIEFSSRSGRPLTSGAAWSDIGARSADQRILQVPAPVRGRLQLPSLRLTTTFPLGLFRAWSNLDLAAGCTVYPQPEAHTVARNHHRPTAFAGGAQRFGEDFVGLRDYTPGDAPAHVAWTALARGAGLVTKQFGSGGADLEWIRWSDVAPELATELALMRLTRWILDLSRTGRSFGLDIPGFRRPPGSGMAHVHACLSALAHFRGQG